MGRGWRPEDVLGGRGRHSQQQEVEGRVVMASGSPRLESARPSPCSSQSSPFVCKARHTWLPISLQIKKFKSGPLQNSASLVHSAIAPPAPPYSVDRPPGLGTLSSLCLECSSPQCLHGSPVQRPSLTILSKIIAPSPLTPHPIFFFLMIYRYLTYFICIWLTVSSPMECKLHEGKGSAQLIAVSPASGTE